MEIHPEGGSKLEIKVFWKYRDSELFANWNSKNEHFPFYIFSSSLCMF